MPTLWKDNYQKHPLLKGVKINAVVLIDNEFVVVVDKYNDVFWATEELREFCSAAVCCVIGSRRPRRTELAKPFVMFDVEGYRYAWMSGILNLLADARV
jgi:hypothetical protein